METITDKKQTLVMCLVFNAKGDVLLIDNYVSTTGGIQEKLERLPGVTVDPSTEPDEIRKLLTTRITEQTGNAGGPGDLVYDDYDDDGTRVLVFLCFLKSYEVENGKWVPLPKINNGNPDLMERIRIHLNNTLFNAQVMKVGNCYENVTTGEAYYVIHLINDNMRQKNFLVLESTMATEPLVLPSDAFWGVPMKWVSHLRYVDVLQYKPEGLAERARHFFISAHNMANQRYDGKPYSFHLGKVVDEFNTFKHLIPEADHGQVEAELWGHDGLEDARLTYNDVKEAFGSHLADGVYSMTEDKGKNRKQRLGDHYYDGLAKDEYGEFKKLCDRLANVRNSVETGHSMGGGYRKELNNFEKRLNTHRDAYEEMWDELKQLIGNVKK